MQYHRLQFSWGFTTGFSKISKTIQRQNLKVHPAVIKNNDNLSSIVNNNYNKHKIPFHFHLTSKLDVLISLHGVDRKNNMI